MGSERRKRDAREANPPEKSNSLGLRRTLRAPRLGVQAGDARTSKKRAHAAKHANVPAQVHQLVVQLLARHHLQSAVSKTAMSTPHVCGGGGGIEEQTWACKAASSEGAR